MYLCRAVGLVAIPGVVIFGGLARGQGCGRWVALGRSGAVNGTIYAMMEFRGELIAGGGFTAAGSEPVNGIAAWDGTSWHALGDGIEAPPGWTPSVTALCVFQGQLIAGGNRRMGDDQTDFVAAWDGTAWHDLGVPGYYLLALSEYQGQLYAGGDFWDDRNGTIDGVTVWDGSGWHAPAADLGNEVDCLAPYQGVLTAGGYNARLGGAYTVLAWDGAEWSHLGASGGVYTGTVDTLAVWGTRLVAGGSFWAHVVEGDGFGNNIVYFDGAAWRSPGVADGTVRALTVLNGRLVAGGSFVSIGGVSAIGIASWDGSVWRPLQSGLGGPVVALHATGNRLFVGGLAGSFAEWVESTADFDGDGEAGTDADVEAFFGCLAGDCCLRCGSADFNGDGDDGKDADIESFFRVLAGGSC